MKTTSWFWINVASHFGIVAALAWLPARWTGQLVEGLAGTQPATGDAQHVALIGSIFGFCVTALIFMGALTVTGELLGFSRPYARRPEPRNEAQVVHRKVLLVAFATLSWVAVGSLAGIASIFAASS
ncbi:hypothetical protein AAHH21_09175 [Stenotrophomonas sp. BSUC-16]|jgi:hypothetical protein|uniref:Uncharacterized protein n=1 Tax=Stenotrophomonas maltophilia TaxID=40324 RepID=A0A246I2F5_STEMA|nr:MULTISPECIES: hypothetical protein [Stenotrophomonas maltophilia group]MBA0271513.1 hypothetical protein [Stenotrophomonas maltophilia]MDT3489731.1 hypothetical protein [Stenotrophomonas maltophilia group sp. msm4]OWQ71495.1 hypothetical protein CEE63_16725 [Stenotrophomonas maltophilia]PSD28634.1 hypothetical protein C7E18_01315 [Stenotrophomonas maltophilia]